MQESQPLILVACKEHIVWHRWNVLEVWLEDFVYDLA